MTLKVNIHEAKTTLSKLLARVANGEEVIIAKAGQPVARVLPIHKKQKKRKPGTAKGKIFIAKDFDSPLPAKLLDMFER